MFDNDKTKVDIKISFVDFIHDQMSVASKGIWIVNKTLQKNSSSHKKHFCHSRSLPSLHTNVISNCLANFLSDFLSNTFCNIYCSKSPWLSANNLDVFILSHTWLENELGNLSRFATARVTRNNQNSILFKHLNDILLVLSDRQRLRGFNWFSNWWLQIRVDQWDSISAVVESFRGKGLSVWIFNLTVVVGVWAFFAFLVRTVTIVIICRFFFLHKSAFLRDFCLYELVDCVELFLVNHAWELLSLIANLRVY